jgi:hypothetical protein
MGIDLERLHSLGDTDTSADMGEPHTQLDRFHVGQYHEITNYVVSQQRRRYNCQRFKEANTRQRF